MDEVTSISPLHCPAHGFVFWKEPVQVYEGVIFNIELDMLEAHIMEAYPAVDRFIVVESPSTFQGTPKPLVFGANLQRFERYMSKIWYVVIEHELQQGVWAIERASRNAVLETLLFFQVPPTALLICADTDEIIKTEVTLTLKHCDLPPFGHLVMPLFYYSLHFMNPNPWKAAFWKTVELLGNQLQYTDTTRTPGMENAYQLDDAGWHCSYFGNESFIINKLHSFAHADVYGRPPYDVPANIHAAISAGKDIFGRETVTYVYVPDDKLKGPKAFYVDQRLREVFLVWDKA